MQRKYLTIGIVSLVAITLLVFLFVSKFRDNITAEGYIRAGLINCSTSTDVACYKDLSAKLVAKFDIPSVIKIFEANENDKDFFQKCHTTLHFLGQETYRKLHDTSRSLSIGSPICFAGFYHGVLEAYMTESGLIYNPEELAQSLPTLCKNNTNTSQKIYNECLHGLGHALMFATNTDLPASLALCDRLNSTSEQEWCYSGTFMENSTSSTNPDHPSKFLKADDPMYPCNTLEQKYLNMCYTLQSFYFAELVNFDWGKNADLCGQIPATYQSGCFNAIGQSLVGFTQDNNLMEQNCRLINNQPGYKSCLAGVIGATGERYQDGPVRAAKFCTQATTSDIQSFCLDQIDLNIPYWFFDIDSRREFCNQIPVLKTKNECRSIN